LQEQLQSRMMLLTSICYQKGGWFINEKQ